MNDPKQANVNALLAAFTDILNKYGAESKEVKDFRKQHAENPELIKLMESAASIKALFDTQIIQ